MKKLECPHCGFIKILGGRELRTFRKRLAGFTCAKCGKKVSSHDLSKKRAGGVKPPGERKKRVRKKVVKEKPEAMIPQPYVNRPMQRHRLPQPTDRTLEEAVASSLNIKVSAPLPTLDLVPNESILSEYLSIQRVQANSGGGSSLLAMVGLTQQETIEEEVLVEESPRELDMNIYLGFNFIFAGLKIDLLGTVEHLPKNVRPLTFGQIRYLKEKLKGLDGYNKIKGFGTAFAEFSALKRGSYGNMFYFSAGTNPWEGVYRVVVDDSLSLEMKKPVKKVRGWGRSIYDPIIDRFIELGHDLVKVNVERRKPAYVASQLGKRIKNRKLEISASSVGGGVYLENDNRRVEG